MIWDHLIVAAELFGSVIRDCVAYAFEIDPSEVVVIHGYDEFPNPCPAKVVCLVQRRNAGFRTIIELVTLWDHEPDRSMVMPRFARASRSDALFAGDLPGDSMYFRVSPDGTVDVVYVDDQVMNDRGEYHIAMYE